MAFENKKRIKKIISLGIVAAIVLSGIVYYATKPDPEPKVRISELSYGNISSRMYVKAQIQPGAIVMQNIPVRQKVLEVLVSPGDQVNKGDILIRLDQSELLDLYLNAKKEREEIEESIRQQRLNEEEQIRLAREQEVKLNRDAEQVTQSLSNFLMNISLLSSMSPTETAQARDISEILVGYFSDFNPEEDSIENILQDITGEISQSTTVTENPEYTLLLEEIQKDIQSLSVSLPNLISSLTSGVTSGLGNSISIPPELLSQFSNLGINLSDPLTQAREDEAMYKAMYDKSVPHISADISGLVAKVSVSVGTYSGASESSSSSGVDSIISDLLGQSVSGLVPGTSNSPESAITIYDNLNPKAAFKVSQFDSSRLSKGLTVEYQISGKSYLGEVIYKSLFVPGTGFDTSDSNDFLSGIGMVTGAGSEPQLDIEMNIKGDDLTELTLGFLIDAQIKTATAENVLVLPAEAMKRELGEYFVFVVDEENTVYRKYFTPGIQSDMFVEVISGLNEGDKVVLNPPNSLQDGIAIEVQGD